MTIFLVTDAANASARISIDSAEITPILLGSNAGLGTQAGSPPPNEQEVLTNADVMKMVQAHLGVDIILEQIRTRLAKFSMNTNDLIKLKQVGVPDNVIAAMQSKQQRTQPKAGPDTAIRQIASASAPNNEKTPFEWDVEDVVDRMTNQHHLEAYLYQHPVAGSAEELQVKASCDSKGMHWLVIYASSTTPATGFKQNPPASGLSAPNVGGIGDLLGTAVAGAANAMRSNLPWVAAQLKLDGQAPLNVAAPSDYKNYARFDFAPNSLTDNSLASTDRVGHDLNVLSAAVNPPAAMLDQLVKANDVLIALPREDGSLIYLEVRPQEAGFRNLVTGCTQPSRQQRDNKAFASYFMEQAREQSSEGHYDSARSLYQKALDLDPENKEAAIGVMGSQFAKENHPATGLLGRGTAVPPAGPSSPPPLTGAALLASGRPDTTSPQTATFTATEFGQQLPRVLQKAAQDHGLSADAYDKEADYIANAVRTCATISPAMARSHEGIILVVDDGQVKELKVRLDDSIANKYGAEYAICQRKDSNRKMYVYDRLEGGVAFMQDVSNVAGHLQGGPNSVHPTRPDVLFVIYQPGDNLNPRDARPGTQLWGDGKGFNLAIKIASDNTPLLWNVHILPDSEAENSGKGAATSSSTGGVPPADPVEQQAMEFFFKKQYQAAFPLFETMCKAGKQNGCGVEGYLYGFGLGVSADPTRGVDLMTKSCDADDSAGCAALGVAYLRGGPVTQDFGKALELLTKSCRGGSTLGCFYEAECYMGGMGTAKDIQRGWEVFDLGCKRGIPQLINSCSDGDAQGCRFLGRCYMRGAGVSRDLTKAKNCYQQACSLGDMGMCSEVAKMQ